MGNLIALGGRFGQSRPGEGKPYQAKDRGLRRECAKEREPAGVMLGSKPKRSTWSGVRFERRSGKL